MDSETIRLVIQMLVIAAGGVGTAYAVVFSLRKQITATKEELKAELSKLGTRIALVEASIETGSQQFGEIRQDYKDLVRQMHAIELKLAKVGIDVPQPENK